jgi:hypothetical protein
LVKNKEKGGGSTLYGAKGRPYSVKDRKALDWEGKDGPRIQKEDKFSKTAVKNCYRETKEHHLSKSDGEVFESEELDNMFKFLFNTLILGQSRRENIPPRFCGKADDYKMWVQHVSTSYRIM